MFKIEDNKRKIKINKNISSLWALEKYILEKFVL